MTTHFPKPRLTVISTAPGQLARNGILALQKADVVLYDSGVTAEQLKHAPPHAKKVLLTGERYCYTPAQLHTLLVDYAFTHGHVVRLKSNAPFNHLPEELAFADAFNIPATFLPAYVKEVDPLLN